MTPVPTDLSEIPATCGSGDVSRFRERARYQLPGMTRVLCTRLSFGLTVLLDVPTDQFDRAGDPARAAASYVVEPELSDDPGEVDALVSDYLKQAELHARVPMTVPWLEDLFDTSQL